MSQFVFNCPYCNQAISTDDSLCGRHDVCPNCENQISIPIPGLEPSVQLGDFELIELLGTGALGEFWKARQISIHRMVTLKILYPIFSANQYFIKRFKNEAIICGKISHPNVVTIYSCGKDKGIHYFALTFVDGKTIASALNEGKIYAETEALEIVKGISRALAYMWNDFKIIHRNIKPGNIMIDVKGNPILTDLGLAKNADETMSLTLTGTVLGTPHYMSPEQAKGDKNIDFRADIYCLGCTLFHMLTGQVPYSCDTSMETMLQHLNAPVPSARKIIPSISTKAEKILKKMMAKNPDKRYHSWEDLIEDIDKILDKELKYAKAIPIVSNTPIHLIIIIISTIILGCIAGGIFYINKNSNSTETSANKQFTDDITENNSEIHPAQKGKISETVKQNQQAPPVIKVLEADNSAIETDDIQIEDNPNYFKTVADNLDVKKHSTEEIESYWDSIVGKRYKWAGKITYYRSLGTNEFEVRVAIPGAKLFNDYNVVLYLKANKETKKLGKNRTILFDGKVFDKQLLKGTGAVIIHLKDIKKLSIY